MEINMINNNLFGALDLGGSFLKYAYGNSKEGILFHSKIAINNPNDSESILCTIDKAILEIKSKQPSITFFAMGSPGTVNSDIGIVTGVTPNLPTLVDIHLKKEIEKRNQINITIENDANLMALGESSFYPNKSLLGFTIGTGIGSGFIDKAGIFRGDFFSALEVGHMIVEPNGRYCKCGKNGCVECYSSATSVLNICKENFPDINFSTIRDVFQTALSNDALKKTVSHLQNYLAIGISNAIMVLNPSVVAIGGGVVDIPEYDFGFLQTAIMSHLEGNYKQTQIVKAKLGNQAGLLGALIMAEKRFLEQNLHINYEKVE